MAKRKHPNRIVSVKQITARRRNFDIYRLKGMLASIDMIHQDGSSYLKNNIICLDKFDTGDIKNHINRMILRRQNI